MNTLLSVIILALVQGVTEFLPVSSSGHLVLLRRLTGLEEAGVILEVVLHLGTLVAVVLFFRRRLLELGGRALRGERDGRRWVLAIVVGTVPAGLAGLLLKDFFEEQFANLLGTGICLVITGLVLLTTGLRPRDSGDDRPGVLRALAVGVAQALAILPGISRSGATIVAGLRCGLSRQAAGELSFFLSLPAVAGAALLKIRDLEGVDLPVFHLVVGATVSALVGYACLGLLMWILKEGRLRLFTPWCLAAGILAILLDLLG